MRRIQRWHQRKYTRCKQKWRCEHSNKPQLWEQPNQQAGCDDGPGQKRRCFVEIVNGATVERKPPQKHRRGMQREPSEQNKIIYVVVPPEAFSPQKHRINGADAVNDYGQKENVAVSEPCHSNKLDWK